MHPFEVIIDALRRTEMSEFECRNGHLVAPSKVIDNRCDICGERIVRMDGLSNAEIRKLEWEWDTRERSDDGESTDNNG